ncbi:hypothetical protein niasHT_004999 [Heterodera trifolii]|uniref:Uncharacterized protein n=1 Tax=Heterodera trifolii TaxID=157864 RepID=A0ABD2LRI6_9BILA
MQCECTGAILEGHKGAGGGPYLDENLGNLFCDQLMVFYSGVCLFDHVVRLGATKSPNTWARTKALTSRSGSVFWVSAPTTDEAEMPENAERIKCQKRKRRRK